MTVDNAPEEFRRKPRLLAIDDDPLMVEIIRHIVQDIGDVTTTTSASEALKMVSILRPDLVLLDVEMPELDGYSICRMIRQNPYLPDLPVLIVTSHTDAASEVKALQAGAVDFISKPLNAAVVQARVKTHLELKERTERLRRLSAIDGLTGLANRRRFDDALFEEWGRALRTKQPLSLLLVDIDQFKKYNDQFGYLSGDDSLRAIAQLLPSFALRPGDLAARFEGDRFAMLLPTCATNGAKSIAEQVKEAVNNLAIPFPQSGGPRTLTVSVGVSTLIVRGTAKSFFANNSPDIVEQVLPDAADFALREAVKAGGNCVRWSSAGSVQLT